MAKQSTQLFVHKDALKESTTEMAERGSKQLLQFVRGEKDVPTKYKIYGCKHCKTTIQGLSQLQQHEGICQKRFCEVCKKTFHYVETFRKHLRQNCPPKRFYCSKCKKSYSRLSDKSVHEQKCCGIPQYNCEKCLRVFLTAKLLENHTCQMRKDGTPATTLTVQDKSDDEIEIIATTSTMREKLDDEVENLSPVPHNKHQPAIQAKSTDEQISDDEIEILSPKTSKTCQPDETLNVLEEADQEDAINKTSETLQLNPSTSLSIQERQIQTFVFLDLETTSLIKKRKFPEITEISLVSVQRDNLHSPAENHLPRVLNKLTLALHPKGLIENAARFITGEQNIMHFK